MSLLDTFNENGYVQIPKNENFADFLSELAPDIKGLCPDYESKEVPIGKYSLLDTALRHRLDEEKLLPAEVVHENPLFGKRISIQAHDLPKNLIPLLQHPHILDNVASVLGTSDIVLLNATIAASYPGNTGNDKQYHCDTANFSDGVKALDCVSQNKFVVNVQVFLDDVDVNLAPMKILPGTHKCNTHLAINSLVSERLGLPDNKDNLVQSNWIYNELIEDFNLIPEALSGERGGISLMNSSVLHAASENLTSSKVRRVAILNYAKRTDRHFRRVYPLKKSKLFLSKIENLTPLFDNYNKSSQLTPHILGRIQKVVNKISEVSARNINRIFHPYYSIMRIRRTFERIINNAGNVEREYLNIGAGPVWLHERFIVIDQCFDSNESLGRLNFNLVHDLPIPFNDNFFKGVYSSHCLEHLNEKEVTTVLKEAHRILRPGGTLRIVVPDMGRIFDAYDQRDASYADWFRKKQHMPGHNWFKDSWLRLNTRSFAGHVVDLFDDEELYSMYENNNREEFVSKIYSRAESNPSYLNVPNAHKSYWTPDTLLKKFEELGFQNCQSVKKGVSRDKAFTNGVVFDNTLPGRSVIVEGTK